MTQTITQENIDIVKSTAPVIKEHGNAITVRMYEIMFTTYPEVKEQFDMTAQANGKQPTKLANAVYAYAKYIDNLGQLKNMVETIAHRHVNVHVRADQYPIVGECLLKAVKDVLGDAATPQIMEAWGQAYQVLAEVFINREQQIYQEAN